MADIELLADLPEEQWDDVKRELERWARIEESKMPTRQKFVFDPCYAKSLAARGRIMCPCTRCSMQLK